MASQLIRKFDNLLGRPPFQCNPELSANLDDLYHALRSAKLDDLKAEKDVVNLLPIIASSLPHGFSKTSPLGFAAVDPRFVAAICRCLTIIAPIATYSLTPLLKELRTAFPGVGDVARLHAAANALDDDTVRLFLGVTPPTAGKKDSSPTPKSAAKASTIMVVNADTLAALCESLILLTPAAQKLVLQRLDTPNKFRSVFNGNSVAAAAVFSALAATGNMSTLLQLSPASLVPCLGVGTLPFFIQLLEQQTSLVLLTDASCWVSGDWACVNDSCLVELIHRLCAGSSIDCFGALFACGIFTSQLESRRFVGGTLDVGNMITTVISALRSASDFVAGKWDTVLGRWVQCYRLLARIVGATRSIVIQSSSSGPLLLADIEIIRLNLQMATTLTVESIINERTRTQLGDERAPSAKGAKKGQTTSSAQPTLTKKQRAPAATLSQVVASPVDPQSVAVELFSMWIDWNDIVAETKCTSAAGLPESASIYESVLSLVVDISFENLRNDIVLNLEKWVTRLMSSDHVAFRTNPIVCMMLTAGNVFHKLVAVAKASPQLPLSPVMQCVFQIGVSSAANAKSNDGRTIVSQDFFAAFVGLLLSAPPSLLAASIVQCFAETMWFVEVPFAATLVHNALWKQRNSRDNFGNLETVISSHMDGCSPQLRHVCEDTARLLVDLWRGVLAAKSEEESASLQKSVEDMRCKFEEVKQRNERIHQEQELLRQQRADAERRREAIASEAQRRSEARAQNASSKLIERQQAALERLLLLQRDESAQRLKQQGEKQAQIAMCREKTVLARDLVEFLRCLGISESRALTVSSKLHHKLLSLSRDDVLEYVVMSGPATVPEDMKARKLKLDAPNSTSVSVAFTDEMPQRTDSGGFWDSVLKVAHACQPAEEIEAVGLPANSDAARELSAHHRLCPLLDLFDLSRFREEELLFATREWCEDSLSIALAAVKAVLDGGDNQKATAATRNGYDDASHMIFAGRKYGLIDEVTHESGGKRICLTPLGVAYHEPFWDPSRSLQKLLQAKIEEARSKLSNAVDDSHSEESDEVFGENEVRFSDEQLI